MGGDVRLDEEGKRRMQARFARLKAHQQLTPYSPSTRHFPPFPPQHRQIRHGGTKLCQEPPPRQNP
jgi:hypothetical protein